MPRPIAPDTWMSRQYIRHPLPAARTHRLRSQLAERRRDPVPLHQIQHDQLRNLAARPALKGHRQSDFKHATQRVPTAILLAECEARHRR